MSKRIHGGPEDAFVLNEDDKEAVESFKELAKTHIRKKNFLELRLRDPESLYEVDEVRKRMKPKR